LFDLWLHCTALGIEDATDDTFDFVYRFLQLLKEEQAELTAAKLYADINWDHIRNVQCLHVLHALLSFVLSLEFMEKDVSTIFQTKFAIYCMRDS